MSTDSQERWIVGLDLGARAHGALAFAGWMQRAASPAERPAIAGVHVIEGWAARALPIAREEYVQKARSIAARHAGEVGCALADVAVIEAERVEDGLADAARGAATLVIGRAAGRASEALVRLGRVARRVLRRLPTPVVVVPPDLDAATLGGPVVVGVDLGEDGGRALDFAVRIARAHGRPLVLAHAGAPRHIDLIDELDPRWLAAREALRADTARAFDGWAEARGLGGLRRTIEHGSPPEALAKIAAREQAALVVVGSRRLSALERVFTTSTASALAGLCACPVAVVPPADG